MHFWCIVPVIYHWSMFMSELLGPDRCLWTVVRSFLHYFDEYYFLKGVMGFQPRKILKCFMHLGIFLLAICYRMFRNFGGLGVAPGKFVRNNFIFSCNISAIYYLSETDLGCYPRKLLRILHAFWCILSVIYDCLFQKWVRSVTPAN